MGRKYQEIDETKSYHREINILRNITNFIWGKMMITAKASQGFHTGNTDTSNFWEQGTIKSLLHLTARSRLQKTQAIMLQQHLFL